MGMQWLCSSILIIVIISTTNSQSVVNKWQIEGNRKQPNTNNNLDSKQRSSNTSSNNYRKTKSTDLINSKSNNENSRSSSTIHQFADQILSSYKNEEIDMKIDEKSSKTHSRKKRLIWVSDDGRLALPPGTVLSITPTLSLPLVRYPPTGFLSNLTMSFPLTIDFDKLGLTDNENPLGVLPPIFGRSMGRAAGSILADYIGKYINSRKKRDTNNQEEDTMNFTQFPSASSNDKDDEKLPELTDKQKYSLHGGERAILYGFVEDLISTFGLNGKACLLRTICEVHSKEIDHLGLIGEMAKLFFTASKSQYSDLLPDYVSAEKVGDGSLGPGECFPYYKNCPRGLFQTARNDKYSETRETDEPNNLEVDSVPEHNNNEVNENNAGKYNM